MKKLIFTLAILFSVASLSAQKMWVGGTFGLWSSHNNGGDSELSYKVLPEFGYVLNENLAVGLSIGGGHTHAGIGDSYSLDFQGTTSASSSVNFYRVNPFLRYSFLKGSLGALFVDGGVAYGKVAFCGTGKDMDAFDVGFKPGIALNVSSKFVLIGKFGFLGYEHFDGSKNSFGFDFNLENIEFGGAFKF